MRGGFLSIVIMVSNSKFKNVSKLGSRTVYCGCGVSVEIKEGVGRYDVKTAKIINSEDDNIC